jgi:hypothetical protein
VCDLETSRIGAPYIYIYDISNLRVNSCKIKKERRKERKKILVPVCELLVEIPKNIQQKVPLSTACYLQVGGIRLLTVDQ